MDSSDSYLYFNSPIFSRKLVRKAYLFEESGKHGFYVALQVPTDEQVEYTFKVDGHWRHSKHQPTTANAYGTLNNVLLVPREVARMIVEEFTAGLAPIDERNGGEYIEERKRNGGTL